ncbi:MAG: thiolase family protein, partial [Syntrophomonadaceae bacterium]|nr:thiolase family protein [Syntrophomonadaceae bacterium]
GSLRGMHIRDLGAVALKEAIKRANIDAGIIDEVIMGIVNQPVDCLNVSKEAALKAEVPESVPCFSVNRLCGSSLQGINVGAMMIMSGEADVVLAGGVENMSNYPHSVVGARWGLRFADAILVDEAVATLKDGETGITSGSSAELLSEKYNISREDMDQFAYESQMKAKAAIESGRFKDEIIPIERNGKLFDTDEHPRLSTTVEKLAKLPAVFKAGGTVTAGNSCGMNDAAAAIVLMSADKAKELKLTPLAKMVSFATGCLHPLYFGEAPVLGVNISLKKAGMTIDQIDLIECNEAFAVQTLAVEKQLKWKHENLNVNGGAIALGHPLGATGGRLMTTLLYELRKRKGRYGVATACTGGGHGVTAIIEALY